MAGMAAVAAAVGAAVAVAVGAAVAAGKFIGSAEKPGSCGRVLFYMCINEHEIFIEYYRTTVFLLEVIEYSYFPQHISTSVQINFH